MLKTTGEITSTVRKCAFYLCFEYKKQYALKRREKKYLRYEVNNINLISL